MSCVYLSVTPASLFDLQSDPAFDPRMWARYVIFAASSSIYLAGATHGKTAHHVPIHTYAPATIVETTMDFKHCIVDNLQRGNDFKTVTAKVILGYPNLHT